VRQESAADIDQLSGEIAGGSSAKRSAVSGVLIGGPLPADNAVALAMHGSTTRACAMSLSPVRPRLALYSMAAWRPLSRRCLRIFAVTPRSSPSVMLTLTARSPRCSRASTAMATRAAFRRTASTSSAAPKGTCRTAADRMVVGDALEGTTDIGPLVDCVGLASVKEHVAHAVAKGARIDPSRWSLANGGTINVRRCVPSRQERRGGKE
jgi:hypothetical protein